MPTRRTRAITGVALVFSPRLRGPQPKIGARAELAQKALAAAEPWRQVATADPLRGRISCTNSARTRRSSTNLIAQKTESLITDTAPLEPAAELANGLSSLMKIAALRPCAPECTRIRAGGDVLSRVRSARPPRSATNGAGIRRSSGAAAASRWRNAGRTRRTPAATPGAATRPDELPRSVRNRRPGTGSSRAPHSPQLPSPRGWRDMPVYNGTLIRAVWDQP
jgi:hypothetical protein